MPDPIKPTLTSAQTDSESGNERLNKVDEIQKHNQAMKVMLDKGLITENDYKNRLQ
jgi:hypothetical protein